MWVFGFDKAYAHRLRNVSRYKKWCLKKRNHSGNEFFSCQERGITWILKHMAMNGADPR